MKKWVSISLLLSMAFYSTSTGAESKNMVYLYGSDGATYEKQLDATLGLIGTVAPDYFHINKDGNLETRIDTNFVKDVKQKGYTVTPFVSNDWDQTAAQKAMQNGDKLADDIATAVIYNNLDGVDIDIENLSASQRDQQTAFLKRLTDKLHANGKTVSIAVPPTTSNTLTGWVGSYDYAAIGKMVDYVFVMGYDYSYPGGPKGPVAPLSWVDHSLSYMVTIIDPQKMILGIPFYGRYWTNQKKGMGIFYPNAMNLVEQNHGNVRYDTASSSVVANYTDSTGNPVEIWIDDTETIKEKIQLVDKYHLAGWGGWHLGQEDPQLWDSVRNGTPYFWDLENHWAKNQIQELSKKQLISGYEDHSFRPDQNISREEVASLLQRIKNFPSGNEVTFSDVTSSSWSYNAVVTMAGQGVMSGYPNGTFKPSQPITRAELSSVLARSFPNLPKDKPVQALPDIQQHWAEGSIMALQQAGIVGGYEDGTFRPDRPVTRAEAAAMIERILQSTAS